MIRRDLATSLVLVLSLAALGCGPKPGAETDATGTSDEATTGQATATTSGAATTSAATSTGAVTTEATTTAGTSETSTSGSTSGSTGSSGSSGGPDVCPPRDPAVTVFWSVEFVGVVLPPELTYDQPCLAMSWEPKPGGGVATFECPWEDGTAKVELTYKRSPELDFAVAPGLMYRLALALEMPWWTERWFSLKEDGGALVLAGIDASRPVPTGQSAEAFYGLSLQAVQGLCAKTRGDCGTVERGALRLAPFGSPVDVLDGHFQQIGDLAGDVFVWAQEVDFLDVVNCTDTPDSWVSALLQASFGP